MSNVPIMSPGAAGGGALAGWDKLFDGAIAKPGGGKSFDITDGAVTQEMIDQYDMLIVKVEGSITLKGNLSKTGYWGIGTDGTTAYLYDGTLSSENAGMTDEIRVCKLATRKSGKYWFMPMCLNSSTGAGNRNVQGNPLLFGVFYVPSTSAAGVNCDIEINVKIYGLRL